MLRNNVRFVLETYLDRDLVARIPPKRVLWCSSYHWSRESHCYSLTASIHGHNSTEAKNKEPHNILALLLRVLNDLPLGVLCSESKNNVKYFTHVSNRNDIFCICGLLP
jgi:hypothetical protein